MLRRLLAVVVAALALLAVVVVPAGSAHADEGNCVLVDDLEQLVCPVTGGGGTTPPPADGDGLVQNTSGGGRVVCKYGGVEVPCTLYGYTWSNSAQCYWQQTTAPGGQTRTGYIYVVCASPSCFDFDASFACIQNNYWWPVGAGGQAAPPVVTVSSTTLASEALASTDITAGPIRMTSNPVEVNPQSMAIVGIPVWIWLDPDSNTTGPVNIIANAGGVQVSAWVFLDTVTFDMGDGTTITCEVVGEGTEPRQVGIPWTRPYAGQASPVGCGHTYQASSAHQINLAYPVTETATWHADWISTTGESGHIDNLTYTTTVHLRVGEIQTIITNIS
jgi:hypothetical protein